MSKIEFIPTLPGLYGVEVEGGPSFSSILRQASRCEDEGNFDLACATRFEAVTRLAEAIGEEEFELDWSDAEARATISLVSASVIDLFLSSEWELCAATAELALMFDSEDHFGVTEILAWACLALGDVECFRELSLDLDDRKPSKGLMNLWAALLDGQTRAAREIALELSGRHPEVVAELLATDHPTDGDYTTEIAKDRPSKEARARELWLRTEVLWSAFPEVIDFLRSNSTPRK